MGKLQVRIVLQKMDIINRELHFINVMAIVRHIQVEVQINAILATHLNIYQEENVFALMVNIYLELLV